MKNRMFNIYVPSYGRAATTKTFKLLEYCTYVVRKSQEEEYRARGIESIWAVDDREIIFARLATILLTIHQSQSYLQ